jgi:sulfate transport system ATP-binding protein
VNLFHGRAHEGLLHLDGVAIATPEHASAQDAQAFAYVRPHELSVQAYAPGLRGIAATLERALVVGPIARLELLPKNPTQSGHDPLIEAHLSTAEWQALGLREGDEVVVAPKKAKVFLHDTAAA